MTLTEEILAWDAASDEALTKFEAELDCHPCKGCEVGWGGAFTDSAGRPVVLGCQDTRKRLADWQRRNPILDHTVFDFAG